MSQTNNDSKTTFQPNMNASLTTGSAHSGPELVPQWAQSILKHGADFGGKLLTYQQYQSQVGLINNAVGVISAPGIDHVQCISNFVDFQKTNSAVLPDQCLMPRCGVPVSILIDSAKKMPSESLEKLQKNMLQSMNDQKQQIADKFLLASVAVSASLIVVQIVKLYNVWKEIKNAENLHKDETKFLEIEQKIKEFESLCIKLNESIAKGQINRVLLQTNQLSTRYTDTILLINDMKIKINGVMQRLDLSADSQIYDGISNVLLASSNVIHLVALFDTLSNTSKTIGGVIVGAFVLLAFGNCGIYNLTQKRLQELRADQKQLHLYELRIKQINSDIQRVLEELEDKV